MSALNLYDDSRYRDFMDLFPQGRRSKVANDFYYRDFSQDNEFIVQEVLREYSRYSKDLKEIIEANYLLALNFCDYSRERMEIPYLERAKFVHENCPVPATERQMRYLRSLGYKGEPVNIRQASDLIDDLVREKKAKTHV